MQKEDLISRIGEALRFLYPKLDDCSMIGDYPPLSNVEGKELERPECPRGLLLSHVCVRGVGGWAVGWVGGWVDTCVWGEG